MILIKIHPHGSVHIFHIVLKDHSIKFGVWQGSIICTLLFLVYINEFLRNSSSSMYADQGPRKIDNWRGGGSYSYIRSLHNYFLLKSIVFMLSEHEHMNISPPIIDLSRSLMRMIQSSTFKVPMLTNFHITMNGKEYFYHVLSTFEAVLCV